MVSKSCLLFIGIYSVCFATTAAAEYPLEFITQDHASVNGMTYGFQLLEDIRQIRMLCEQRRNELEQHFTTELQNWMQYSQQSQLITSRSNFEGYVKEKKQVIDKTIANTYSEIYSSRKRRLNVIQSQCDNSLEQLLTQRKLSMLTLITDLLSYDRDKLNKLVNELTTYKKQLQDGVASCMATQAMQYESRLSSKVLQPEDYCSGPDIKILTAFSNRMLNIIVQEQLQFFGDDEDLAIETPCGISGCKEHPDSPSESSSPPTLTMDTQPTQEPYQLPQSEEPSNHVTEASRVKPVSSTPNTPPKMQSTPDGITHQITTQDTPTTQPEGITKPVIKANETVSDGRTDQIPTQGTQTTQPEASLYSTEPVIELLTEATTVHDNDKAEYAVTKQTQTKISTYDSENIVTPEPESKVTPEPESKVTPEPESKVTPEPENIVVTTEPESKVTPEPENIVTPEPESRVTPQPESNVIPEPENIVTPEPESKVTPEPENIVTPEPESRVTPQPESKVIPEPENIVTPESRVTPQPESRGTPEPESKVTPEPESKDVPEWLDDAVNNVLNPHRQNQTIVKGRFQNKQHKGSFEDEEDSTSKSQQRNPTATDHHKGSFEEGSEDQDSTGKRHRRPTNDDSSTEAATSSDRSLHYSLIYSFAIVVFALVVAALVILGAAVMLHRKRGQLMAAKLLTEDQKIATMKETGYINPTYKLENDE